MNARDHGLLYRLYTRLINAWFLVLAVIVGAAGVILILLFGDAPLGKLGEWLALGALLGVVGEVFSRSVRGNQERERIREINAEQTAILQDSIIAATTDQAIETRIAARVGDAGLAASLHQDFVRRLDASRYRCNDTRITVTITDGGAISSTEGEEPLFNILVRYSYRTRTPLGAQTFLFTANRRHYQRALADDSTNVWLADDRDPHLIAARPEGFGIVDYLVNDEAQAITVERSGEELSYAVTPAIAVQPGESYHVSYSYKALVPQRAHTVWLDVEHPTHGLSVDFHHRDTNITRLTMLDFLAGATRLRHAEPASVAPVSASTDDWVHPRSGLVFIWRLTDAG